MADIITRYYARTVLGHIEPHALMCFAGALNAFICPTQRTKIGAPLTLRLFAIVFWLCVFSLLGQYLNLLLRTYSFSGMCHP